MKFKAFQFFCIFFETFFRHIFLFKFFECRCWFSVHWILNNTFSNNISLYFHSKRIRIFAVSSKNVTESSIFSQMDVAIFFPDEIQSHHYMVLYLTKHLEYTCTDSRLMTSHFSLKMMTNTVKNYNPYKSRNYAFFWSV